MTAGLCCATDSGVTIRELPPSMQSLGALVAGCSTEQDEAIIRARCDGGVVLSMTTHPVGEEPRYRGEAFALAQASGARLQWDQIVVATEGPTGVVDRAQALVPGSDRPVATLIGALRGLEDGSRNVQEIWCNGEGDAGDRRCRDMVGAVLSGPAAPRAPEATTKRPSAPRAPPGSVSLFGRALSLPTTCAPQAVGDGGDATCDDGMSASWRRFDTMEEATETVTGTLAALGDDVEGAAFPCTVAGEAARCEDHERAVAAIAYVDGRPAAVLCLGPHAARPHSLCRALLVER